MATINLGRVKPVFQGAYSGSTAYVVDDMVSHSGSTYICIAATTGNAPTDTSYWHKMAAGSDLGGLSGLTAGDIAVYDGTSWVRQAIGTSGQILKVNSSANGFDFGEDVGGKLLQQKQSWNTTKHSTTATIATYYENTSSTQGTQIASVSMTRQSSTSTIFVWGHSAGQIGGNQGGGVGLYYGTTRLAMSLSNGYAADVWGCSPHAAVASSTVGSGAVTYQIRLLGSRDGSAMYSYQYAGNQNMGSFYSGITVMEVEV